VFKTVRYLLKLFLLVNRKLNCTYCVTVKNFLMMVMMIIMAQATE